MGQNSIDSWTSPLYESFYNNNDDNTEYEYELVENYNGNYLQLYSATEYKTKIQEIEIRTEPQTKIEELKDAFDLEKRKYQH